MRANDIIPGASQLKRERQAQRSRHQIKTNPKVRGFLHFRNYQSTEIDDEQAPPGDDDYYSYDFEGEAALVAMCQRGTTLSYEGWDVPGPPNPPIITEFFETRAHQIARTRREREQDERLQREYEARERKEKDELEAAVREARRYKKKRREEGRKLVDKIEERLWEISGKDPGATAAILEKFEKVIKVGCPKHAQAHALYYITGIYLDQGRLAVERLHPLKITGLVL